MLTVFLLSFLPLIPTLQNPNSILYVFEKKNPDSLIGRQFLYAPFPEIQKSCNVLKSRLLALINNNISSSSISSSGSGSGSCRSNTMGWGTTYI